MNKNGEVQNLCTITHSEQLLEIVALWSYLCILY